MIGVIITTDFAERRRACLLDSADRPAASRQGLSPSRQARAVRAAPRHAWPRGLAERGAKPRGGSI